MSDWTKEPYVDPEEERRKEKALRIRTLLLFIGQHPEGVTAKDLDKAGIPANGIEKLLSLKRIVGTQVREPERGSRAFHWVWKIRKD